MLECRKPESDSRLQAILLFCIAWRAAAVGFCMAALALSSGFSQKGWSYPVKAQTDFGQAGTPNSGQVDASKSDATKVDANKVDAPESGQANLNKLEETKEPEPQISWSLAMTAAKGLWSKGDYKKAFEIFLECERQARRDSAEPGKLCETLYYLGDCSKYLCKYDAAEKYMQERLSMLQKESRDVRQLPICYSELASIFKRQGRLEESVQYYELGLKNLAEADRSGITGATTLDNMGIVLQMQGKWTEAVKAHEEALAIYEKTSGVEEIDKLYCLGNLGQAYFGSKEFAKAEAFMLQALEGVKKLEGSDSLPSATFSDNLGCFYYRRGDCKHALEYQEIALRNFQKNLGLEHPEVAICLENIAHTYVCLDRKDKAIQCVERALSINLKVLGADHPNSKGSRKFLQELNASQEKDKIDHRNSPDA